MPRALQAFLGNIVDYAGIFPPAKLPLDQAWRRYLHYRTLPQAWLLGRFVCPAAQLAELAAHIEQASDASKSSDGASPIALAVLGRGGQTAQEYFANVKTDLGDIAGLHALCPQQVAADAYEVRLPAKAFLPPKAHQIASLVATTAFLIETNGPPNLTPFFEAPDSERETVLALIQAIHDDRQSREAQARTRCQAPGFKLRTGGIDPAAFPSTESVALALAACRAAQVSFKATAGLHQPFRHFDPALGVKMHGFVNLFAAGCFAWATPLTEAQVRAVLEEENGSQFRLDDAGLYWRELHATVDNIATARRSLLVAFGSCSFDEPCQHLRQLRWL